MNFKLLIETNLKTRKFVTINTDLLTILYYIYLVGGLVLNK